MPFDSFFGSKNLSPAAKKAAEAALCGRFDFFLSETNGSDKRAFAFFEALSPAETVFAEYAAAFPELFGSAVCDAARKFFLLPRENDPSLATEELPDGIGAAHIGLLKELYAVARRLDKKNKNAEASSFVENYERFASSVFDLRFEGAALERLKDAFYEDERLQIASPDWMKTKENRLVLEPLPPLRPLFRAGEKTARTLADILTLCIFRDGAFPVFDPNEWFLTENGEIFLKKCSRFIVLSLTERRFLNGFIAAFEKENFLEAAKLLFKNKTLPPYFPMSELTKSLESIRRKDTDAFSRAETVFKELGKAGVSLPPSFFLLRFSLSSFKTFAEETLNVKSGLWFEAAESFKEWIGVEPKSEFSSPADFLDKGAEMPETYALTRRVQGKKMTNFVKNKKLIPEMIKRAEAGYRFRSRPSGIGANALIPLLALGFLTAAIVLF